MRVSAVRKPFNRRRFSTTWVEGTGPAARPSEQAAAACLFLAAAAATLTIAAPTPLAAWAYALVVLLAAAFWSMARAGKERKKDPVPSAAPGSAKCWLQTRRAARGAALAAIAAWGACQWSSGTTISRYATLDGWTRAAALVAALWLAECVLGNRALGGRYLRAFVWFAGAVSAAGVLAYYTSPGRILWIFPSPYPDTWGPFLSRNDFAALLELAYPVALWRALAPSPHAVSSVAPRTRDSTASSARRVPRENQTAYLCLAAWLLAAGLASASRAGSVLLAGETLFVLARHPARQGALRFAAVAVSLVAVAGAGTLWHRWQEKDPWRTRREIQQSALEMIADRPIWGFGIGTFARAYPAYARFDLGAKVEHAHSDWLEWAAEGGLPYALAWLVVAVSVAKPASRSTWGIGVIAVFLHAFVDYPFARFGISAWTMTLAGIIGAAEKRDEEREVAAGAH